jgi:TatD DNase family protein
MLVDSHCHLNYPDFSESLEEILKNSKEAGVKYLQTICTNLEEFDTIWRIALDNLNVFCSVGIHPDEIRADNIVSKEEIIKLANLEKVIGIGETGLDYYRNIDFTKFQINSFKEHIGAARVTDLPVIIHTRDAEEDTLSILREEMVIGEFPALIHCFTGTKEFAEKMLDLGLYISISGIVTFKKAEALQEIVKYLPLDRILIETDAPFLAPIPYRGKRNEPAFIKHTAQFIAELKNIEFEELADMTTNNFFRLFKKATQIT